MLEVAFTANARRSDQGAAVDAIATVAATVAAASEIEALGAHGVAAIAAAADQVVAALIETGSAGLPSMEADRRLADVVDALFAIATGPAVQLEIAAVMLESARRAEVGAGHRRAAHVVAGADLTAGATDSTARVAT
jgi:hypothetical protein